MLYRVRFGGNEAASAIHKNCGILSQFPNVMRREGVSLKKKECKIGIMTTMIAYVVQFLFKKSIVKTAMVATSIGVLVLGLVVLDGWANETINLPVSKPGEIEAVQGSNSPTTQPPTTQTPPTLIIPVVPRDAKAREQARRDAEAKEQVRQDAETKEQARRDVEAREKSQREAKAREKVQREAETRKQVQREKKAKATLEAAGVIALSANTMNWDDARAYCESKGGRLPLVNGNNKYWNGDGRGFAPIEVFGAVGSPWPSWLPSDQLYWTGTRSTHGQDLRSWDVRNNGGLVDVGSNSRNRRYRVICIR